MGELTSIETQKQAAAEAAAALIEDGMVLGLGTGSTAKLVVDALGRRTRDEKLQITAVATSVRTEEQARA
ncbi:MAG: ribose 5-phosphate isomerase A, partial [Acetobacteraceae bacterium]|nr:ribose 5-phosphate isomerase A [Acetobacteraceae bacterium]